MDITSRQQKILKAIITEFIKTGEPVGSLFLSDRYKLGVSSATLRAEMSRLANRGYLYKEHSSSGRVPSTLGLRFYLTEQFNEERPNRLAEARAKERIFQKRFDRNKFLREAVKALAEWSNMVSISLIDDVIFYSGIGQLLSNPQFADLLMLQKALQIVESESLLLSIFNKYRKGDELKILIGDEIGLDPFESCSLVYAPFRFFRGQRGFLGVIGPRSMPYSHVIPAVRNIAKIIEESISGWE